MENTYREGQFVWRELMSADIKKAAAFYGELLGWTSQEMPMPTGNYTIFKKGDLMVGGGMQIPEGAPMPSAWMSYVSVKDTDEALKVAGDSGGKVIMPAMTVPGVGRFGAVASPSGSVVGVMRGESGDAPAQERPVAGSFCWESLNTTDADADKVFYTKVTNWTTGSGPGGAPIFKAGEAAVGDIGSAPPGVPSHWLLHVVVEKLDAARDKAEKLGAKIMMPNIDVPTIGRFAVIADPTGAALSLFEPAPPAAA